MAENEMKFFSGMWMAGGGVRQTSQQRMLVVLFEGSALKLETFECVSKWQPFPANNK